MAITDTLDPAYACSEDTHVTLDDSVCIEVKDVVSGIDKDAKKEQMLRLYTMGSNRLDQKMDFVMIWNSLMNFNFSEVPEDIEAYNENCREGMLCVEDAWVSLAAVMPSFIEDNQTYVDNSGTAQVIYSYQVHQPPDGADYSGEGGSCIPPPPTNRYGDCKTQFRHLDETQLKITADGKVEKVSPIQFGHNVLVDFITVSDSPLFQAELDVSNIVTRESWEWEKERICCESGEKGCKKYGYEYSCERVPNQVTVYGERLTDGLETTKYTSRLGEPVLYNLSIFDSHTDPLIDLKTAVESFDLRVDKSSAHYSAYESRINYKHAPYNILEVTRTEVDNLFSDMNVLKGGNGTFLFDLPKTDFQQTCSINLIEPFSEKTEPCQINYQQSTKFSASTDKAVYSEGEEISLKISITNDSVDYLSVSYGGKNYGVPVEDGMAFLDLQAISDENNILISINGEETIKKISVNPPGRYSHLLIFGLSICLVFLMFKAYSKFYLEKY
ncbi:MAG: hypothetical protein ABIA37_05250 [Candidatus Woesearchaeota archaeon]